MLRRVLALRLITAADMATFTAHSQVNPSHSHLETLFATLGSSRVDFMNMIQMSALRFGHSILLPGA
jgi:hypothetical protein